MSDKVTTTARFRRINESLADGLTYPCILARLVTGSILGCKYGCWETKTVYGYGELARLHESYTHWLPIEFPEVRG